MDNLVAAAGAAARKQKQAQWAAARLAACRFHEIAAGPVKLPTLAHARAFWAEGNLDKAKKVPPTCRAHAAVLLASYNEFQGKLVKKKVSRENMVDVVCVHKSCNYRHAYHFSTSKHGRSGWILSRFEKHNCHGKAESGVSTNYSTGPNPPSLGAPPRPAPVWEGGKHSRSWGRGPSPTKGGTRVGSGLGRAPPPIFAGRTFHSISWRQETEDRRQEELK